MNTERLNHVMGLTLLSGGHNADQAEEMCVMEAVAYVAGEPWGDHPRCACLVISAFMRSWNDSLSDEDRNRLLRPLIPRLVGTRSTAAVEERRAYIALDWYLRVMTPTFLGLVPSLEARATALRGAAPVVDVDSARAIHELVIAARDDTAAAWDAARDAAWDAAWAAAGDAARKFLRPTVEALQQSALEMVERMLSVQP